MRTKNNLAVVLCSSLLVGSCASVPEQSDARWHVALLPICPSEAEPKRGTPLKALLLLGVDRLIDRALSELTRIAKEDVEGKSSTIVSGGYLWWHAVGQESSGLASCAVVSLSSSSPAQWCDVTDSPFKEHGGICNLFEQLQASPQAATILPGHWQGSALPRFYAEIQLTASKGQRGVTPTAVLFYYPKGLHGGKYEREGPRTLALTISTEKLPSGPAMATLVATLEDIRPSKTIDSRKKALPREVTGWIPVLEKPDTQTQTDAAAGTHIGSLPVNIKAEVREVGDPNKFLQALVKILKLAEPIMKQEARETVENRL